MTKVEPEALGIGSKIPDINLKSFDPAELGKIGDISQLTPKTLNLKEFFASKKVAVFTITGAFTPVCTSKQLSGFAQNIENLKQKGVNEIVCISVNDIFTLAAFAKHTETVGKISFIADGNAEFARKIHLFEDLTGKDLGYRMKRSAMLVENGEIKYIGVDPSGEKESSVEAILTFLNKK